MLFKHNKKNYRLIFGGFLLSLIVVVFIVLATPQTTYAITVEPIYKVLGGDSPVSEQIKSVWNQILNFVNSIAIVMLIFIAFTNILRININTYGIKKFLPSLALAIIAANFSYLFCRILVDLANVACDLFINGVNTSGITGGFDFTSFKLTEYTQWPRILILAIFEFIGAVFIAILAFLFFIRNYLIYFLVALSPIAIVCMVLPLTKSVFNMWWQQFWKWTFMPVVSLFWLWIAAQWVSSLSPSGGILAFAFAIVCYYLAITTPFKMGGAIMQQWSQAPKKYGGYGLRQVGGVGARMSFAGQNLQKRNAPGTWQNKFGQILERGGGVVNIPKSYEALKKKRQLAIENLDKAGVKTGTYKRLGGSNVIIEGERAKWEDVLKNAPPERTGQEMGERENAILAELTAMRTRRAKVMSSELGKFVVGGNIHAVSEQDRRRALRQHLAADGVPNLLMKYRGMGGTNGKLNNESEAVYTEGVAKNFIKDAKGQRTRRDLQPNYDATVGPGAVLPTPVSAVGEREEEFAETQQQAQANLRNLGGAAAGGALANAALHGSGDFTVYANNLHLNTSPQARAQAEESFNALRGRRDVIRGEEMRDHEQRIDEEMNGAYFVHEQLQRPSQAGRPLGIADQNNRLETMGRSASKGLSALESGDMASAVSEAKKFGHTDLSEDTSERERQLSSLFRSIESGVKDVRSQRDASSGAIPDWSKIETSLRSAKSAQAEKTADTTASARIITDQHAPTIVQNVGDATVADALSEQSQHLAELTQNVNKVAEETAKVRGMQPVALSSQQSQQTLLGAISGAGVSKDTPMSDAMSNPEVRRRFAQQIGKSIVESQRHVPQVDAVRPRGPQPPNTPDVTNVTNTHVTNVNQPGAGRQPLPPPVTPPAPTNHEPPQPPPPFNAPRP